MEKITLRNAIREIAIENENGELVHTLRIDISDSTITERFANLVSNINNSAQEYKNTSAEMAEAHGDEKLTINHIVDASKLHAKFIDSCVTEIDAMFGRGTVKAIFAENYKINPDYVPDDAALTAFVEMVIPIMGKLFGERAAENKAKYNIHRRGKRK